jgi:hypothetical protein
MDMKQKDLHLYHSVSVRVVCIHRYLGWICPFPPFRSFVSSLCIFEFDTSCPTNGSLNEAIYDR